MLPQNSKSSWIRTAFCVAGAFTLSTASAAMSDVRADYFCEPSGVETRYVSPENIGRLRALRQREPASTPFQDLADENLPIVDEALRVGTSGGFFAARLLRDLAIIDAFESQIECDSNQDCPKPEIITGFFRDNVTADSSSRSWQTLIRDWKQFRNKDAERSQACLEVSKARPSYEGLVVAENDPKPSPVARGNTADSMPHSPGKPSESSVSDTSKSSKEIGLPRELVDLDPAEVRFCKARSDDAHDKSEVSNEQIQQLRDDYGRGDTTILFDMNAKYREPLEEALRVGPKAGYFAHRALRNLVIIKEVQRQIACPVEETCLLTEDIRALKQNNSWSETLAVWKSVRDTDLQRALACVKFSKTLPTLELVTAVAALANTPKNDNHVACGIETPRDGVIVHFEKNRAVVTRTELSKVIEVAALLKECPGLGAFVAGYTDRDGGRKFNARLSRARAAAVRTHLVMGGVKGEQVESRGYGVARQRSTRATRELKAQDRRAEIWIRKIVGGNIQLR
jgi:outer membrane protein OmpA-like peptidoglycan-associated protein